MFSRQRAAVLLVAVSLLLAGCLGDSPPATPTTGTPTASDPTTTTQSPTTPLPTTQTPGTDGPPGIDGSGIRDFDTLRTAHEETLLADGGVLRFSSRLVRSDGSLDQASNLTYRFGPGASRVSVTGVELQNSASQSTIEIYLDESNQTTRRDRDGAIEYSVRPRTMEPGTLVWANLPWYIEQDAGSLRVNDSLSGPDRTVLDASIDQFPNSPGNESTIAMVVSSTGVVERFETRTAIPGEGAAYIREFEVRQIGGVTVPQPSWLGEVPPSASLVIDLFSSITDAGALQLEHVGGGDAVPPGTVVQVEAAGTVREATVATPVPPGQSMYVALDPSGDLAISTVPPQAGSIDPLPAEFTVRVVTTDGLTLFEESLGWRPPQTTGR